MKKLAVLSDFQEENWPSMDLSSDMLMQHWPANASISAVRECPPFWHFCPGALERHKIVVNADRLLNRFVRYPEHVRRIRRKFDAFHVVDHSYSHLLCDLPCEVAGVFCHDLDTFRSVLDARAEPRPRWFRAMVGRILDGFSRADVIFHATRTVGQQLIDHGLTEPNRLVHCPLGVDATFSITHAQLEPISKFLLNRFGSKVPYLLHVGSCIARKRIDVLLAVTAKLHGMGYSLRLLQVGGTFTPDQRHQISRLGIGDRVAQIREVPRDVVASAYRCARAVLVTSESEGFGLPVIEAIACGAPVIASDIPVLREVGQEAIDYATPGDVEAWVQRCVEIIERVETLEMRKIRCSYSTRFSWQHHAETIMRTYERLLTRTR